MSEHKEREHFIPIRKADLIELICREPGWTAVERDEFRQCCRMLEATFHFEFHQKLEELKNAYAPFDPDADTRALSRLTPDEKQQRLDGLLDQFVWLLERANFKRLSQVDIHKALEASSEWGLNLHVDFNLFDRLEVFARGDTVERRFRRRFRRLLRQEEVQVPIFQRLVVILRLRSHKRLAKHADTESVYIKIFKDIPKMDLEMLFPGTQARMSLTDRVKITLPTVTGLGMTGWKLAGGAVTLATSAVSNTAAILGLAGGTIGYGIRSFYGYLNTKKKYQLTLAESLYFQNLDNNAGVLFRLLDEAEEQECREAILAYYFLWREAGDQGWTAEELDDRIEHYLERAAHVRVDFEIGDALEKLRRLQMVEILPGGRLRAAPIQVALENLDRAWDNYFPYHNRQPQAARVSA